jgi:hypothetical protein
VAFRLAYINSESNMEGSEMMTMSRKLTVHREIQEREGKMGLARSSLKVSKVILGLLALVKQV